MYIVPQEILEKHKTGLEAARAYWVLGQPTGLSDAYFNELEAAAREDGLELRDYVTQEIQGTRTQNADYIGKVEKIQVPGSMWQAIHEFQGQWESENPGRTLRWIPKYDGSSIAAYYDPETGHCVRVVTIGGTNLGSEGIDQTEKLRKFFPELPGTGIQALQAELLVSLEHGFGESSRQKANGLVNASYEPLPQGTKTDKEYSRYLKSFKKNYDQVYQEIDSYINLRCFRYFISPDWTSPTDYQGAMQSLPVVVNSVGDIKFCSGLIMSIEDIDQGFIEKDIWTTDTGTFMVDGVVAYTADTGECVKALKYKDAGRGESTIVREIKWNNQATKGKDSWSANALIDPIMIRGSKVTKPTVGSIKKMVTGNISPGARVTLILANSTIPAISEVLEPGNGDFGWPICNCGYQMGPGDMYGALLKCGNPMCTDRLERMRNYLSGVQKPEDLNLDKLLVLDRVKLSEKPGLQEKVLEVLKNGDEVKFKETIEFCLTTELQRKNLELVYRPAYQAANEWYQRF